MNVFAVAIKGRKYFNFCGEPYITFRLFLFEMNIFTGVLNSIYDNEMTLGKQSFWCVFQHEVWFNLVSNPFLEYIFVPFLRACFPRLCFKLGLSHDDVIKWKQFTHNIFRSPVNSPHIGQWRGALMFSLICARINGVNNLEAGDLRGHRALYDGTVMNGHFDWSSQLEIISRIGTGLCLRSKIMWFVFWNQCYRHFRW